MSRELADLALAVAREAGALITAERARGVAVAATKTTDIDIVTETDRAAEALIRDRLASVRPDDALLGEEGDDVPGTSGVRWVIDPIDGTVNFLYGLPNYAVSIAAERDGEAVAGCVLNVAAGTARGDKAVEGQGPFGHISAQGFEILDKGGRIVFSGKARLELRPQAMKAAKK